MKNQNKGTELILNIKKIFLKPYQILKTFILKYNQNNAQQT